MSSPIFYASVGEIEEETGRISLHGAEGRHLAKSPRVKRGESIMVGDGTGTKYEATVTSVAPDEICARIESRTEVVREIPALTLVEAVSKLQHMDETIGRAAEAGVETVIPFISPRSPLVSHDKLEGRLERWRRIALEASKVARRVRPLVIGEPMGWPPGIHELSRHELNIVLWEEERLQNMANVLPVEKHSNIGIIVGPEGGLSSGEIEMLEELGCVKASIGDLILRTETAGSYTAMLIRYHYGLLSRERV